MIAAYSMVAGVIASALVRGFELQEFLYACSDCLLLCFCLGKASVIVSKVPPLVPGRDKLVVPDFHE